MCRFTRTHKHQKDKVQLVSIILRITASTSADCLWRFVQHLRLFKRIFDVPGHRPESKFHCQLLILRKSITIVGGQPYPDLSTGISRFEFAADNPHRYLVTLQMTHLACTLAWRRRTPLFCRRLVTSTSCTASCGTRVGPRDAIGRGRGAACPRRVFGPRRAWVVSRPSSLAVAVFCLRGAELCVAAATACAIERCSCLQAARSRHPLRNCAAPVRGCPPGSISQQVTYREKWTRVGRPTQDVSISCQSLSHPTQLRNVPWKMFRAKSQNET